MANEDKLWTQQALYALAKSAALEVIQSRGGLALPCKVIALNPNGPNGQPLGYSFVQVQFEVNVPYTKPDGTKGTYTLPPLVLPKAEGQWIRSATQVGDFGVTQALDTSHGGVSGMSAGVSNLGTAYGNLSTLVFVPIANTDFGEAPSPDRVWVNGIQGADTSDTAQTAITTHAPNNITHTAGVGTSTEVQSTYNGTAASITHKAGVGQSTQVYILFDGAGNAISHVVSSGGLIGLGALASTLNSARAVPAQADIQTLANNIVGQSLVALASAMGAAIGSSSSTWATAQAALKTIFEAAAFVPNISGINPTIPGCSSITRVAP